MPTIICGRCPAAYVHLYKPAGRYLEFLTQATPRGTLLQVGGVGKEAAVRVRVDAEFCQATGTCTRLAPDVFELGRQGAVKARIDESVASARDSVLQALGTARWAPSGSKIDVPARPPRFPAPGDGRGGFASQDAAPAALGSGVESEHWFDELIIATGARARRLAFGEVPVCDCADATPQPRA